MQRVGREDCLCVKRSMQICACRRAWYGKMENKYFSYPCLACTTEVGILFWLRITKVR